MSRYSDQRPRPTREAIRAAAYDRVYNRTDGQLADTDPKYIELVAAEEKRLTAAMTEEQTFNIKLTRDELTILSFVMAVADDGERVLKDTYELGEAEPVDAYFTAQQLQRKLAKLKWREYPAIAIASDGRCSCSCGDPCPLGRRGSLERCTREELVAHHVPVTPPTKKG